MGSFTRFARYLKDFWKVVIRGENDDLQRQTLGIQEQLARIRNRRMTNEKERESAALNQARGAVEKLRELHESLLAAEQAASEFAAKIGEHAKSNIEAETEIREKTRMKFFLKQKELYQQGIKMEMQANAGAPTSELLSQLNQLDGSDKELEQKISTEGEHGILSPAMGGRAVDEVGLDQKPCANVEGGVMMSNTQNEEIRQPGGSSMHEEPMVSSFSLGKSEEDNKVEFMEAVSPTILAQVMEEARKQAQLEAKAHVEALSRNKAILEKEIEARENAECVRMSQGHK